MEELPSLLLGVGGAPTRMPGNAHQSEISHKVRFSNSDPGASGRAWLIVALHNLTPIRGGGCCDPIWQVSRREV